MTKESHQALLSRYRLIKILLVAVSVISVCIGLLGAYTIYENNKTTGLNNGRITVESCQEIDWGRRIHSCTGNYFSSGGGMIERDNVSVTVFGGELKKGAIVPDVYPRNAYSAESATTFVTGRERASVTYNIPSLVLVFSGIAIPLITIILLASNRIKR